MDEQNIPIDINTTKLLDWLVSRRHVKTDWQNNVLKIREKINNAIQDMPAHEGIIKLLSGQHINYFHCLKIIEILRETEADSKNLFGRYGSQRMKDWQDIVACYQKDNVYLAEAAQMLIRNVSYEIPGLRKQVQKLQQSQLECEKNIKDYTKTENSMLKEFKQSCEQLGIEGDKIKPELLRLLKDLPDIYRGISEKIKIVQPALELYNEFNKYLSGKATDVSTLPLLDHLIKNGNTTVYEYTYGEKPVDVEEPPIEPSEGDNSSSNLGDIDFGDNGNAAIDFGDDGNAAIDFGDDEATVDWGQQDDGFEIVSHSDLNLEESGIVVEKTGVARGDEALTLLDHPETRARIIDGLVELSAFAKMRLYETMHDGDVLTMSRMQDAPAAIQMQTLESATMLNDCLQVALDRLTDKRIQHLHNVKHSPKYVDILTGNLNQKLAVVDRMRAGKAALEEKIVRLRNEANTIDPVIDTLIEQTKVLQKEIQADISGKYKGRVVNIVVVIN
ncbi:unnamed protein product [Phyllotreta striolata]|uniref:CDK5 regulatory subunit-associated protein 3 n=1 Tax=Phyllotreta striolata TaxID=444603 RepID=A0A9N9XMX1_PHYSR|nr:unnamed protein product [Phyllotreta striolata]